LVAGPAASVVLVVVLVLVLDLTRVFEDEEEDENEEDGAFGFFRPASRDCFGNDFEEAGRAHHENSRPQAE